MVCSCFCFFFYSLIVFFFCFFFFSSRRRHTRCSRDWSSDVCSSDLEARHEARPRHLFRARLGQARELRVVVEERAQVPGAVLDRVEHAHQLLRVFRRSEEHTSELQSRLHLVCRLLLEKKKKNTNKRN